MLEVMIMDLNNIETIMSSKLWRAMIHHRSFHGFYIVHTNRHNPNVGCALWIFFGHNIQDKTIESYHLAGARMCKGEMLDRRKLPIECYGKVLVFS